MRGHEIREGQWAAGDPGHCKGLGASVLGLCPVPCGAGGVRVGPEPPCPAQPGRQGGWVCHAPEAAGSCLRWGRGREPASQPPGDGPHPCRSSLPRVLVGWWVLTHTRSDRPGPRRAPSPGPGRCADSAEAARSSDFCTCHPRGRRGGRRLPDCAPVGVSPQFFTESREFKVYHLSVCEELSSR